MFQTAKRNNDNIWELTREREGSIKLAAFKPFN